MAVLSADFWREGGRKQQVLAFCRQFGNNGGGNSNLNPGPIPNPKPNKDGDGTQNLIPKDVFTNRTANSSNFGKQLPNTGTEELSLLAPLALTAISFGGLLVFGKKRED